MKSRKITKKMIISELLNNNRSAKQAIDRYAKLHIYKENPLKIKHKNKIYARTGDLLPLLDNPRNLSTYRSNNSQFLLRLGSILLEDIGYRSDYVEYPRLLRTWLHSPRSVCAILLCFQPSFNAFCGVDSPRFTLSRLEQLANQKVKV